MKIPNKRELQQITSNYSADIEFKDFMILYKDYIIEWFSFLVDYVALPSDNSLGFRKNLKWLLVKKFKHPIIKSKKTKVHMI